MEIKDLYKELSALNVNEHVEKKKDLNYLSWTWAIDIISKKTSNFEYEIEFFDGLPYVYDEKTGYMVFTNVTLEGVKKRMWLPVMDANNNAMLNKPYEYTTKFGTKRVEAATMFDVNKTIMRCLVKNLAMFGLGTYIYAGEDLPSDSGKSVVSANVVDEVRQDLIKQCNELNMALDKVAEAYGYSSFQDIPNQVIEEAIARKRKLLAKQGSKQ